MRCSSRRDVRMRLLEQREQPRHDPLPQVHHRHDADGRAAYPAIAQPLARLFGEIENPAGIFQRGGARRQ